MKKLIALSLAALAFASMAEAKMDMATLPKRDSVQLTIYNSADLTLARDKRELTLSKGLNRLQLSWAGTLIDPTSLDMVALGQKDKIEVFNLAYPPRVRELGLWQLRSEVAGKVPFEITYLTSGLSWRAFYMGTLASDEKTMRLEGYVRVTNNSGEDYENAQVRLIVGQVHVLDEIAVLARQEHPFGSPLEGRKLRRKDVKAREAKAEFMAMDMAMAAPAGKMPQPKEIKKEGLSEYFLYTIEGSETVKNNESKRLPSLDVSAVPVKNLYKYEAERYGGSAVRFLSFKNDKEHKLGDTPIPGGLLRVYRSVDEAGHLSYEGASEFKYIPVEEDVELSLGPTDNIVVEPKLMDEKTDNYIFDNNGDVSGWDDIQMWKVEVKNTRVVPARVEITRNFPGPHWALERKDEIGEYAKIDLDTVRFTLELEARSKKEFVYVLTIHQGRRAQ